MAHRRYRPPDEHRYVSLAQIAKEIGRTEHQTAKLLTKVGFIGLKPQKGLPGRTYSYPASALEVLKALLGIPHRHIGPDDWLSNYLGGTDDRRLPPPAGRAAPPRSP